MGDSGVRRSIIVELSSQFPGLYTDDNIAFVGTHSHAGVGGYMENLLPQLTSLGYVKQTADAVIAGTVLAVQRAHASLAPGKLSFGNATILDANINRSPTAYLANPADERARYQYDQDKDMTVLRFDDLKGNARGLLSFFAVHGTSLYEVRYFYPYEDLGNNIYWVQNNTLVSTDNKGMAAYLYEGMMYTTFTRVSRPILHECSLRGTQFLARKHVFYCWIHTMWVNSVFFTHTCSACL